MHLQNYLKVEGIWLGSGLCDLGVTEKNPLSLFLDMLSHCGNIFMILIPNAQSYHLATSVTGVGN